MNYKYFKEHVPQKKNSKMFFLKKSKCNIIVFLMDMYNMILLLLLLSLCMIK